MFGYLFASLLLPMFARLLKAKEGLRPLVSMSFKLIWAGSVTLAAAIFFAREDLLRLMMPERATEYRFEVLGLLIWAFVPVSVTYIFSTLLTARERMMRMNRFFVVGIAIDLLLNMMLIPHYQALGSAMAALTTQIFIAAAMVWLCVQEFEFRPSLQGMVQTLGFFIYILVFDWFLFETLQLAWPLKFISALGIGLVGLFLFKMVSLASFKTLR